MKTNLTQDKHAVGYTITNIHRGKGAREHIVYANLVGRDGTLLISATLQYIVEKLTRSCHEMSDLDEDESEHNEARRALSNQENMIDD